MREERDLRIGGGISGDPVMLARHLTRRLQQTGLCSLAWPAFLYTNLAFSFRTRRDHRCLQWRRAVQL